MIYRILLGLTRRDACHPAITPLCCISVLSSEWGILNVVYGSLTVTDEYQ